MDAEVFPEFAPSPLGFCERRCRARLGGLRQSVPARLFVEPLGFQSMLSQTRSVFDRVVSQTIRLPVEALKFGDVSDQRSMRRSFGRSEYRRAQGPPRRLAARARLRDAIGRCERSASSKPGKARCRLFDLLFHGALRLCGFVSLARGSLECVCKLNNILGARYREPRQRFEVGNRRI